MVEFNQSVNRKLPEWRYSLVGGAISLPLTIGYNWLFDPGYYSLAMVTIGGVIAGYLAKRNSLRIYFAGIGAGAIGAIPGLLLSLNTLYDTASRWIASSPVIFTTIVVPLTVLLILAMGVILGFIGGGIGGWLATKLNGRRASQTIT